MMRKYDMRICSCGRIHMIQNDKLHDAFENNKDFLLICGGCGAATLIGADEEPDWDNPERICFNLYSKSLPTNKEYITESNFSSNVLDNKPISAIMHSNGYKVPMLTGEYANNYFGGKFTDMVYPDLYKIQRKDITVQEIMNFIDKYNHDRTTVNMDRFINETPAEILEEISNYTIDGFNWKNTKYEKYKEEQMMNITDVDTGVKLSMNYEEVATELKRCMDNKSIIKIFINNKSDNTLLGDLTAVNDDNEWKIDEYVTNISNAFSYIDEFLRDLDGYNARIFVIFNDETIKVIF